MFEKEPHSNHKSNLFLVVSHGVPIFASVKASGVLSSGSIMLEASEGQVHLESA